MSEEDQKKETNEFVFARLRLAQQLIEESDHLEGRNGYDFGSEKWWFHPRHEREALVVYLLLTCFDRLGQLKRYISFANWLKSTKAVYVTERNRVLTSLSSSLSPVETAYKLNEAYQDIYGVKNSFCQGILNLSEEVKEQFLKSVSLTFNPEFGMHGTNVSTPSFPLEDKKKELELKLKYLYNKRNSFTHRLEQYHSSSIPIASEHVVQNGSSWGAIFKDSRLFYMGVHQEHEKLQSGGANVYTVSDWPFILFETLYSSIGIKFDRTNINLTFQVKVFSKDKSYRTTYDGVSHKYLKDFENFIEQNSKS